MKEAFLAERRLLPFLTRGRGERIQKKSRGSFLRPLEKRGWRRCRRQAPPFSGSAPTTFRLYRYSNEGRPSGSGRNSYVSSNYSNFLSQNSRQKLPRSLPPRRKRNRWLRPPRGDLRSSRATPSAPACHPPTVAFRRSTLSRRPLSQFRGAVAKSQRASTAFAFPIRGIPPSATRPRG